jgi:hypothetical protein
LHKSLPLLLAFVLGALLGGNAWAERVVDEGGRSYRAALSHGERTATTARDAVSAPISAPSESGKGAAATKPAEHWRLRVAPVRPVVRVATAVGVGGFAPRWSLPRRDGREPPDPDA